MKIIQKYKVWYGISLALIVASIAALILFGLKPGIDFTGGTLVEVEFNNDVDVQTVRQALKDISLPSEPAISSTGRGSVLIKASELSKEDVSRIVDTLQQNLTQNPETGVTSVETKQTQTIGPVVGDSLTRKAIIAVILSVICIVLYVAWSFRRVQKPFSSWALSSATIIALVHDIIITLGFTSVINHYYGYEANSYLVVALLTILGFSVHDTIVVFDRIRENLLHAPAQTPVMTTVNNSINQTIARSLNTSLTVLLVLIALAGLGGTSIKPLVLTLTAGIAIGTYSSIFIASPILVTWDKIKSRRNAK